MVIFQFSTLIYITPQYLVKFFPRQQDIVKNGKNFFKFFSKNFH